MAENGLPENYDKQVEQVVAMAISIIYDEQARIDQTLLPETYQKAQQTSPHPDDAGPQAVAEVGMKILSRVEGLVERQGKQIDPIIVAGAIGPIIEEVAELSATAGIVELSEEDMQISVASAVSIYIGQAVKSGKITQEELQEVAQVLEAEYPEEKQQFEQMVQARNQRQQTQGQQAPPQQQPPTQMPQGGQPGL